MLFNSLIFLVFFPIVTLIYFILPHKFRWLFLLGASYYFYLSWRPIFAFLILGSTIVTYLCGLLLESTKSIRLKRTYLTFSLIINFSILFIFKYFNFINTSVFSLLESLGIRWEVPNLNLLLPIGISFYTFKAVGYTIDVYRGDIRAERHFGIYALFVSFFPQLLAGPIERAKNLLPQFHKPNFFSTDNLTKGFKMALWGYFLKLVLADRLAAYVDAVYNNITHHSGSSLTLASFFFTFQIYGDFAGYSLIAIGVAKVMGFNIMNNFNRPYFSANIGQFWHRWHISLSTWFKDYVYIPLGGNRVGRNRNYFNLFITFFISGIWHGANFTFMIWGALHGFYIIIEKMFGISDQQFSKGFNFRYVSRIVITFILVTFAWIFFRANTVSDVWLIINKIFTNLNGPLFVRWEIFFVATISLLILLMKEVSDEFLPSKYALLENRNTFVRVGSYAVLISIIILFGVFDTGKFIYFQF